MSAPTPFARLRRRAVLVSCGLLPLAFVGCGGEDGARPTATETIEPSDPGSGPVDCAADEELELLPIETFELGAATTAYTNNEVCESCADFDGPLADATRNLAEDPENEDLIAARDAVLEDRDACRAACRASQSPTDLDKPLPATEIPKGRCESRLALHVVGGPFYDWGGKIGFQFSPGIDVREWEGVAFWGRVRPGARSTVRVDVIDASSDPKFLDENGEPLCDEETTLDDYANGCDAFGGYAIMTGDWQLFTLPFEELRQAGFGLKAPFLDLGAIRGVTFAYTTGSWDLWLDDVAFYRKAGSTR